MIGGKRSSRCFEEQMRPKSVEWCSACCGERREAAAAGVGLCARCGGSGMEPVLTFAEANACVSAGLAVHRICDQFAARRMGDAV